MAAQNSRDTPGEKHREKERRRAAEALAASTRVADWSDAGGHGRY